MQDIARELSLVADMATHVVFGASHPANASTGQRKQILKVNIGLVEDRDLARHQPGAQREHATAVMMRALLDDGERGQESL